MLKDRKRLYNFFLNKAYHENYSGLSGFFFNLAHKNLEKNIKHQYIKTIEIGSGQFSHYNFIKNKEHVNYEMTSDNINDIKILKKKFKQKKKLKIYQLSIKEFLKSSLKYDRIILSHVLEHLDDPEKILDKIYKKKLNNNGIISITLPCDPGLVWDLGRFWQFIKKYKKYGIKKSDYYYFMATEHINPITNLIRIINFNYKYINENYLPFFIKSVNFNLMYNVTIFKSA
jgi:SAM-dependent methyltransferase